MMRSLSTSSAKHKDHTKSVSRHNANAATQSFLKWLTWTRWILTLLEAEAGGPLLQGDVVVAVGVALLEEASGAVLHGNEGGAQGGELCVGQVAGEHETQTKQMNKPGVWGSF